mmetsp:Transcript_11367/g.47354  ORF Transcript_11367/g.47354 Transcript_11367/m.47354 type:complete len:84 (+) Transcript_11367:1356-1607(+)
MSSVPFRCSSLVERRANESIQDKVGISETRQNADAERKMDALLVDILRRIQSDFILYYAVTMTQINTRPYIFENLLVGLGQTL